MKPFAIVLALVLGSVLLPLSPAEAGDAQIWRYNRHTDQGPFPLSERAQSVWTSGACWTECGSYTAWDLVACLEHDAQGHCLKRADHGDRMCQRTCRTSGGPWLPDIFDF
ncbi:MAG TPA: hypothetical protein VFC45_07340 [Pseudolabrys sp.]|nr:hypothetical protein [Pseudolabrys sp.]